MSSLDFRSALAGGAATVAVALSLGLARQDPAAETASPPAPPVGRYQVAIGENLSSTVLLDTATGDAWRVVYVPQADRWTYDPMGHPERPPEGQGR